MRPHAAVQSLPDMLESAVQHVTIAIDAYAALVTSFAGNVAVMRSAHCTACAIILVRLRAPLPHPPPAPPLNPIVHCARQRIRGAAARPFRQDRPGRQPLCPR